MILEYIFHNKKKKNIFLLIKILKNLYNIIIDNIYLIDIILENFSF